jgi:Transposase DDE domain group 1
LEVRHRRHARVEDSVRQGKDTGMRNLPHHAFEHTQTWLELSLIAQDLLTWMNLTCLAGELQNAEPKRLRHWLLHTAGRVVRHGRRTHLKLDRDWPWSTTLAAAFARLRAIPALC